MKMFLVLLSMLTVPAVSTAAQAHAALTAERCQPLTSENAAACCSASNWRDIILPESQMSCASANGSSTQKETDVDAVGSVTRPNDGGDTTPTGSGSSGDNTAGNPGNTDTVGQSGEKGMDGESPSTGTKGNSN